jgi:hypothetical protein
MIEQYYNLWQQQEQPRDLESICHLLKIRQIHDSAIMHLEIWRNYLEIQEICKNDVFKAESSSFYILTTLLSVVRRGYIILSREHWE